MSAPIVWLLRLAVRVLRAPAARRRLLPLLHPGHLTDSAGRRLPRPWTVPAPALGGRCVPGCTDPRIDWDGAHYCQVQVGLITGLPATRRCDAAGAVVEVTQAQGEPRQVWVLPLDRDGGYAGDGMRFTPGAAADLAALLDTAFVLAEQVAPVRRPGAGAR